MAETTLALRPDAPMCGVCGKPVDYFGFYDDQFMEQRYFIVKCHGRREKVRVDFDTMEKVRAIGFGLAFADGQRRLSP